ncbi:transposable element-derived 1-like [Octopus vulgaris]|uniref:Transposable element-derived 1-like n=1 Tax=Octopus vulgaris TaxID=6645 RepID=A0AA36F7C3_OCTVU|nr:transposable element-derived 1-like [Octopus vulgaris]
MPSRAYIMKDEARSPTFKAQMYRMILIICENSVGFMMKPGLIYKSANLGAFKPKNKNLLLVHLMHNTKAWITKSLTLNWSQQCFSPQAKEYLPNVCMEFKMLIIMDNAGGHFLDLNHEGVQVEFLPANTTRLIQLMDQGVIDTFKALYTRNSLQHLVDTMESDENFKLKEYWRNFTIATCLSVIHAAPKDMKKETPHLLLKEDVPIYVQDYERFSPEDIQHKAVDNVVKLVKHMKNVVKHLTKRRHLKRFKFSLLCSHYVHYSHHHCLKSISFNIGE